VACISVVEEKMEYKVELSNVRNFSAWLGGREVLDNVIICGLENSLTEIVVSEFDGQVPTQTEINDFLWDERNYIYDKLGFYEYIEE